MASALSLLPQLLSLALASRALPRAIARTRGIATRAPAPLLQADAAGPTSLVIIDGHALAYRMNFALQKTGMSTRDGVETHVLHGFCIRLLGLATENFDGAHLAVAFDLPGPTFRSALQESYKATRPPMPMGLRAQVEVIREACALFGVPALSEPGFEADDVIATCVRHARAASVPSVVVVTSDKDLMQLVSSAEDVAAGGPAVAVYDDRKRVMYDAATVEAKFGVRPSQLGDYLSLLGDASDNVPGVPGVGAKKAAALLGDYGDLEGCLARAPLDPALTMTKAGKPKKPPKWLVSLTDNANTARAGRTLIALRDDVPIDEGSRLGARLDLSSVELVPFLERYELRKLQAKVKKLRKREDVKREDGRLAELEMQMEMDLDDAF